MKLFEVSVWGNEEDGPNGPDTNYLVVAPDHEAAAALVRPDQPDLNQIIEIGACGFEVDAPLVFRGPYLQPAMPRGTRWVAWSWNKEIEAWVGSPHRQDGLATCRHPNGQLAAEVTFRDGHAVGPWTTWYPDGTPMEREVPKGEVGGLREAWYADGTLASRYDTDAEGAGTYQRFARDGTLVAEGRMRGGVVE